MYAYTYPDGQIPRICIIGAGFAGLCAAIQLKRNLKFQTFTIIERSHDVGGVWLANAYPGCAVDIPGQLYSYSFEQSPSWSKFYPSQPEVWKYTQKLAKKYDLYPQIRFNTSVQTMNWDENRKVWRVTTTTIKDDDELKATEQVEDFEIVIIATGPLHEPHYPPEFNSFQGPMMHSAAWDSTIKLENKVVGVVGVGASGVQIIPEIASKTKQLIVYQRSPQYIIPRLQFQIPNICKFLFFILPFLLWAVRCLIYLAGELAYLSYRNNGILNGLIQQYCTLRISWNFRGKKNQALARALKPKYPFGYKLFLTSSKYYDVFHQPHVKLNSSTITKVEGRNIITQNGESQKLDVLILCTGFKLQDYFAPMHVFGINGVDILAKWKKDRPRLYYGITCHEAPNLFVLYGPNTANGHNSAIFTMECQVNFILKTLKEMMKQNANSVQVSLEAQDECMNEIINKLNQTVWANDDDEEGGRMKMVSSFLANNNGENTTIWPKTATNYWRKTRNFDSTKFNFTFRRQIQKTLEV